MIARIWHGQVQAEKSKSYHDYLLKTGLKDYKETEGNKGVFLLKRDDNEIVHYYTLTFWTDYPAIRKFAGGDFTKARYYPEDKQYLLEFEETVTHFEVLEMPEFFYT
jgi:heme-degrading monooxygenase HmoA